MLELVEGLTLADRIAQGPVPCDEALPIARQIAEALEAAHEQGIIHRDLKPANIKLTRHGKVKVLDFGLAKLLDPQAVVGSGRALGSGLTNSPTVTSPAMTMAGVILGTAAYMSPEQAKGRVPDKRCDVWAYGVVLMELLAGKPLFTGETVSEVLAAVIMKEADFGILPPTVPAAARRLLRRCLQKDPERRMRDIGEARLAIDGLNEEETVADVPRAAAVSPRWYIGLTSVLALALAVAIVLLWRAGPGVAPLMRYDVAAPAKTSLNLADRPAVALSPDGSTLAFIGVDNGVNRLFIRRRDEAEARPVAGSEGATEPVFSPDGQSLAFFSETSLKKLTGDGTITLITHVESATNARGLAWLDDGSLVYPPGFASGLVQASTNGGDPKVLTTVDRSKGERTHRWPSALPGGRAVIFTVGTQASPDDYDASDIEALVLATGERRVVLKGASMASYVATGHLVFARGGSLYAVRFDPGTLQIDGGARLVLQGLGGDRTTGATHFSIAGDGTLAYIAGGTTTGDRRLTWVDRQGGLQPLDLPPGLYADPQISPDGTRLALTTAGSGTMDIWIYDFSRKTFTRLTFGGQNWTPIWSPDGKSIFYSAIENGQTSTLFRKLADGSLDAQPLARVDGEAYLSDVREGVAIMSLQIRSEKQARASQNLDIVRVAMTPSGTPTPIVSTSFSEFGGVVSPNGRFLAYQSNESGRTEIYVRDFPGPGGRWQVSTAGGEEPHWSADGHELFYRNNNLFMAADVDGRAVFQASTPKRLFDGVYNLRTSTLLSFSVDPKSGRFLMMRPAGADSEASRVRVVLNWFTELHQRVPTR